MINKQRSDFCYSDNPIIFSLNLFRGGLGWETMLPWRLYNILNTDSCNATVHGAIAIMASPGNIYHRTQGSHLFHGLQQHIERQRN